MIGLNPMALLPRRIQEFHSPEDVTHHSPREVHPREVGLTQSDISAIWAEVVRFYRTGLHPAMALCIRRHGKIILERSIGHARGNAPDDPKGGPLVPATPDTPFNLFSASKSVTAMLIHLLIERGLLSLDQAVADSIPEFARYGKGAITIRHLLCHRAGIPTVPPEAVDPRYLANPEAILAVCCALRPEYPPGKVVAYHPLTTGFIFAEVIQRVTGKDIQTFLRDEIRTPLGFQHLTYGAPPEVIPTVARDVITGPEPRYPVSKWLERALGTTANEVVRIATEESFLSSIVPSGNVIATANEAGRFFELLLRKGTLDDTEIFKPETLAQARVSHSCGEFDRILKLPADFGLGFMLGGQFLSVYGLNTTQAFGHVGFSNVMCWADPERDISVAFMNSGKPVFTPEFLLWLTVPHMISRRIPRDGPLDD